MCQDNSKRCSQVKGVIVVMSVAMVAALIYGSLVVSQSEKSESIVLADNVAIDPMMDYLKDLQNIAYLTENNGSRSVLNGYNDSAQYVKSKLVAAGYTVLEDYFQVIISLEYQQPFFQRVGSNPENYTYIADYQTLEYSTGGVFVNASLGVPVNSNLGCNSSAYSNFPQGAIALVSRGTCTFYEKNEAARQAGAVAILIYDNVVATNSFSGTCSWENQLPQIPCVSLNADTGAGLVSLINNPGTLVNLNVYRSVENTTTYNLIADYPSGDQDETVVIGSHLDSVPAGPGINDNGSGSAFLLHLATIMKQLGMEPKNRVRFGWWAAEEIGLLGSDHYVNTLTKDELAQIAANLNFDMIGSPNAIRGVYNGSSNSSSSGVIQSIFEDYFNSLAPSAPFKLLPFDKRSDYQAFVDAGLPAGGVFTGAETVKSPDERDKFGGVANSAYDPCYHQACDTVTNIDTDWYLKMAQAAAHTLQTLFDEEHLNTYLLESVTPPTPAPLSKLNLRARSPTARTSTAARSTARAAAPPTRGIKIGSKQPAL